ncbi:MAG: hypothetical protein NTX92_07200, partial [Euryarchaeota archaeon]|nr:hypothetical protein [Euryarchaeota archaeon]
PDERTTLKSQLLTVKQDLAIARDKYPLQQPRDPMNMEKGIIADRLTQIDEAVDKIVYACDHPDAATEERL